MSEHRACHGCLDGCTKESAVHCISCVAQPWPCDATLLREAIALALRDFERRDEIGAVDGLRFALNTTGVFA